jgi:putative ABC transport system permease protein
MRDAIVQDIRYALRVLRHSPLFTATAALSLAIGIGASTTIFSVANALLLRPLPGLTRAHRLVDIGRTQDGHGFDTVSFPNYRDLRERSTTIEDIYAYRVEPEPMSLSIDANAERVYGAVVTANYFTVLGVKPALGRLLQDADDGPDAPALVVLSYPMWTRRFASDRAIAGRTITINNHPFMVAGVAPQGFQGTTILKPDLWVPMSAMASAVPRMDTQIFKQRISVWLAMGGRLKDGVSIRQADAEAKTIGAALLQAYPNENRGKNFTVRPSSLVPGQVTPITAFMGLLMTIVGLVLLIACVNLAGMLLARGVVRRREFAVRAAIGAGRMRLAQQLLIETSILFAVAGLLGILLTNWLAALLVAIVPKIPLPIGLEIHIDWRVAVFAAALTLVATVLSGLPPALQATRPDLVPALKSEGFDSGSGSRLRLRNLFVIGQVTMSIMLVVIAGLFLRALQHAADVQPGFDERNVDVVQLDLSLGGYKEATARAFVHDLLDRTRALPGVESATLGVDLPLDGGRMGFGRISVPGKKPAQGDAFPADWNVVEPDFFKTMKLPLLRGRDFTDADTAASQPVAIVNEALANAIWPGEDPIGKQVTVDGDGRPQQVTIVGVAFNARLIWLTGKVESYIYVPFGQRYLSRVSLLVRTTGHSAIPEVRQLMRSLNPNLPVTEAMPLSNVTAIGLVPQRVAASVAGTLGLVGLLLAAIGIYGVTAYAVSRRTREIGIRIALGADERAVMRLILRQGLTLAGIGVTVGLAIAAAGSKLLESLLFGVRGPDPVTFAGACVLFTVVTLIATYVPARRALAVDPVGALRAE